MSPSPSTERALRVALAAISLLGLAIAVYLTVERARGAAPVCVVGGGCARVQASSYAELAGIPVAWLGIAGYLGLLTSALTPGLPGRALGLFVAIVSAGLSGWLTYVELGILHDVCIWCVSSAILVALSLIVCVLRARAGEGPRGAPAGASLESSPSA